MKNYQQLHYEKAGLQWADRVIIYDEDGLLARAGAFADGKHTVQWIKSMEELLCLFYLLQHIGSIEH